MNVVRIERNLAYPIERVWRAVTEPDELAEWFVARPGWVPELGETFSAAGVDGRITELAPPRVFGWEHGTQSFRFELTPNGEGTLLVFTHEFEGGPPPAQHAAGWGMYFHRLEVHLHGEHLTEADAHTQGYLIDLDGRPAIRFHRFLDFSIGRVWTAVSTSDGLTAWFPGEVELKELIVGGALRFTDQGFGFDGTITELDEPRVLAFDWGTAHISIELTELTPQRTLLTLTQLISDENMAARNAAGWQQCLESLLKEAGAENEWATYYDAYKRQGMPYGAPIPGREP